MGLVSGQPEWTTEFTVGAVLRNVAGGGHLFIGPSRMEFTPGRLSRGISKTERIRHQMANVVMYRAPHVAYESRFPAHFPWRPRALG
jgi:hypothetical protein